MAKEEENQTLSSTAEFNLFIVELGGNVRMDIFLKMPTVNTANGDKIKGQQCL